MCLTYILVLMTLGNRILFIRTLKCRLVHFLNTADQLSANWNPALINVLSKFVLLFINIL